MKKLYDAPKTEFIIFQSGDIITTSDSYFYDEKEKEHVYDIGSWFN